MSKNLKNVEFSKFDDEPETAQFRKKRSNPKKKHIKDDRHRKNLKDIDW